MGSDTSEKIEILETKDIHLNDYAPDERKMMFLSLASEDFPEWMITILAEKYERYLIDQLFHIKPTMPNSMLRKLFIMAELVPAVTFSKKDAQDKSVLMSFDRKTQAIIADSGSLTVIPADIEISIVGYIMGSDVKFVTDITSPEIKPLPAADEIVVFYDQWLNRLHKQNIFPVVGTPPTEVQLRANGGKLASVSAQQHQTELAKLLSVNLGPPVVLELADVLAYRILDIFLLSKTHGIDDPSAKQKIKTFNETRIRKISALKIEAERVKQLTVHNYIRKIIFNRFGKNKLDEIDAAANSKGAFGEQLIDMLPPADKKSVTTEIKNRRIVEEAIASNTCEHIDDLRRLDKKRFNSDKLSTLSSWYTDAAYKTAVEENKFIMCSSCELPLICPHKIIMLRQLDTRSLAIALEPLIDYAGFCITCGEKLPTYTIDSERHDVNMQPELRDMIETEIRLTGNNFNMPPMINLIALRDNLRAKIYQPIVDLKNSISKSNTTTSMESKVKLRYYVSLYAYAHFIKLCTEGKGFSVGSFAGGPKNGAGSTGPNVAKLFADALRLFVSNKNILLNELKISTDSVKVTLINIYKSIVEGVKVEKTSTERSLFSTIINDVVYQILLDYNYREQPMKSNLDPAMRLDVLLGQSCKSMSSRTKVNLWEKITIPPAASEGTKYLLSRAKTGEVDKFMFDDNNMWTQDIESHVKKLDTLRTQEHERARLQRIAASKPWGWGLPRGKLSGRSIIRPTSLNEIFDTQGNYHKFDRYVVDGADYSLKDYPKGVKWSARKCSTCGYVNGSGAIITDATISEKLSLIAEIKIIHSYFKNICPIDMLKHVKESGKCAKCGHEDQPNLEFANMWKEKYHKLTTRKISETAATQPANVYVINLDNWRYDFVVVNDLASSHKIDPIYITSIGAVAGQSFELVENNSFVPAEEKSAEGSRVSCIVSYIRMLIIEYNKLRNHFNDPSPSKKISEMITKVGYPTSEITLLAKLPAIEFIYAIADNPASQIDLLIETFCKIVLYFQQWTGELLSLPTGKVAKCEVKMPKETAVLLKLFGTYMFNEILKYEKLSAKPEIFNKHAMYSYEEANNGDDDEDFDTGVRKNRTEQPEGMKNQFDVSAFDVEDEEDIELNVGEDLGL
jgi:hypothetical protein